jgi:hypothetical protein
MELNGSKGNKRAKQSFQMCPNTINGNDKTSINKAVGQYLLHRGGQVGTSEQNLEAGFPHREK